MQQTISLLVLWVTVPGVMLGLLFYAIGIVSGASQSEGKTSAKAGFWAGLVLFVVYVVSQLHAAREPNFRFGSLPQFDLSSMGTGLVGGFLLLWGVRFLAPTRLVGLVTLILAAASSSALFSYVFIESLRSTMVFLTLGTALGALLHVVFFPDSVRKR